VQATINSLWQRLDAASTREANMRQKLARTELFLQERALAGVQQQSLSRRQTPSPGSGAEPRGSTTAGIPVEGAGRPTSSSNSRDVFLQDKESANNITHLDTRSW
jgi:hypothetical protein